MGTQKHPEKVRPFGNRNAQPHRGDMNRKSKQIMRVKDGMAKSGHDIRTYGIHPKKKKERNNGNG